MKVSLLGASCALLSIVMGLGFVLSGRTCAATAKNEQKFLSDPDVAVCELETTTLSKLDLWKNRWPSFIHKMERARRQTIKQGQIILSDRPWKILLGDSPEREFYLYDVALGRGPSWFGSWSLHSHYRIDGRFFEFMIVEDGTKIAGRPYKGDLGIIKVGKGGRDLEKIEFKGSVRKAGDASAPIGMVERRRGAVSQCRIPVGNYTAHDLTVKYDDLAIGVAYNYYTNAKGQLQGKEVVYGMKVHRDKPYVLDFSNRPMVIFGRPFGNTPFSRGDEIRFAAIMIDPELDIMILRLDDTSVMADREYKDSAGKVIRTLRLPKSLDPRVVITRADGEIVAEGVMPFG